MLDQLIYTRCSPHRDLKNNGQVVRGDGFGVFSVSADLFTSGKVMNYDFLQSRLAIQNGAKETSPVGLFNSYEYASISPDSFMLSYEVARPHCKIPRANGQGHRTGTYIKQGLVGSIEGYPVEWFGATAWDAHLKSENDYYLDGDTNASPALLAQVSNVPQNGYINVEKIKHFVDDGRAEAVKAGIWFLLQEFDKAENDRKVLLIKDIPENVELWISAIEFGFSAPMAQKITFTTNRSKLGTQADSILFYYTDESGRFYPMMNRSVPQTRHPYCMIVGYHPKDTFCASVKQMATSNFAIIDGTTKSTSFQPDNSIKMPYYSAVVQYDADIKDFCNVILPSLPCRDLTGRLPELFDAYKYLLDTNHKSDRWDFSDAIHYLNVFLQFGTPNNQALSNYIIVECVNAYNRFANEDEIQGFPLLKCMWNLSRSVGKERDIIGLMADVVSYKLNNLTLRNGGITNTWHALNTAGLISTVQPVLRDLFNDTELSDYAKQIKNCDPDTVETVLDMFFQALTCERMGISSITGSNEKYSFVCLAVVALLNDTVRLTRFLEKLNTSQELFNAVSISVGEYLDKYDPSKSILWWDIVLDICGGNVLDLCRKLCSSKTANMDMVEQLLSNRIEKTHRFDNETGRAFTEVVKTLGKNPTTGFRLFSTWIKCSSPNEFSDIIRAIKKCALSASVEEKLFDVIDSRLLYDTARSINPMIYRDINQWGISLNKTSVGAALFDYKRSMEKEHKVENAVKLTHALINMNLTVNKDFISSDYFADIAAISSNFCDANLHVAILCLFANIENTTLDFYVDSYLKEILSDTKGRNLVPQLVALCEATEYRVNVPNRTATFVSDVQHMLEVSLTKQLVNYYKPSLVDQVLKYTECEHSIQIKLVTLLKDVGEKTSHKGLGGLFNNLFGKR